MVIGTTRFPLDVYNVLTGKDCSHCGWFTAGSRQFDE